MTGEAFSATETFLAPGTRVEVRNRFNGSWASGFKVESFNKEANKYKLVRISDGALLQGEFERDELRREPRSRSTWWIRTF